MAHPALSSGYINVKSNIITMSTILDSIDVPFYLKRIFWNVTTAITSTWSLHVTQSTNVTGTTYAWPLIGTSAVAVYPGCGHTTQGYAALAPFEFECVVYGLTLATMTTGSITIVKGYMTGAEVGW
jgi:hypothetical protein